MSNGDTIRVNFSLKINEGFTKVIVRMLHKNTEP